jgi:hypothetical protein
MRKEKIEIYNFSFNSSLSVHKYVIYIASMKNRCYFNIQYKRYLLLKFFRDNSIKVTS